MPRERILAALAAIAALAACGTARATTTVPPTVPPPGPVEWLTPLLTPAPGVPRPSASGKSRLLVIGDSLTRSMYADLPLMLPGWRIGVNGNGGRPLAEGMAWLQIYKLPKDGRTILAMSLFTNDPPTHVRQLKAAVRESLRRVGPHGCVIWATILRPKADFGIGYHAANEALRALAAGHRDTMRLVRWSETVRRTHMPLREGVHPGTPAAWDVRARLFADAARTC
jgi:hypothetical protein